MYDDEVLSKEFKSKFQDNKNMLLNRIYEEIAYLIEYHEKYELSHDFDPPYDCSGHLVRTKTSYNVNDYKNVSEFLEEYNDSQYATYTSGCGLMPVTHYENVESVIIDYTNEITEEMVKDINKRYGDIIYKESYELYDLIEGFIYETTYNTLEEIEDLDLVDMYNKGISFAKKRRQLEEDIEKRNNKIRLADNEESEDILSRLHELYLDEYGVRLFRITKESIDDYLDFRKFLKENFTNREIRLLGKYQSQLFSNSIAIELSRM